MGKRHAESDICVFICFMLLKRVRACWHRCDMVCPWGYMGVTEIEYFVFQDIMNEMLYEAISLSLFLVSLSLAIRTHKYRQHLWNRSHYKVFGNYLCAYRRNDAFLVLGLPDTFAVFQVIRRGLQNWGPSKCHRIFRRTTNIYVFTLTSWTVPDLEYTPALGDDGFIFVSAFRAA